jgi:hypothetical protein
MPRQDRTKIKVVADKWPSNSANTGKKRARSARPQQQTLHPSFPVPFLSPSPSRRARQPLGHRRQRVLLVRAGGNREPSSIPVVDAAPSVERQTDSTCPVPANAGIVQRAADVCEDAAWSTAEQTGGA